MGLYKGNKMTPFSFEILLHYYYSTEEYSAPRNPKAVVEAIEALIGYGLLEKIPVNDESPERVKGDASFQTTEKGTFWIKTVLNTPFPVSNWIIPGREREPTHSIL